MTVDWRTIGVELYKTSGTWLPQVLVTLAITLIVFVVVFSIINTFVRRHKCKADKEQHLWVPALLTALRKPLYVLIWFVGLLFCLQVIKESITQLPLFDLLGPFRSIVIMVIAFWFLQSFITNAKVLALAGHGSKKIDITTIHALVKIGRVLAWLFVILGVLNKFGVPLSGIIALGGGGALGVSFAAKDLLANFFGGWVVIVDKPFKVGDWIEIPNRKIEGTVEYIGWRSTRIRSFDKRPIYVPNSMFTNLEIVNPQRMTNRRIKQVVGVRYDDASKLAGITEAIEKMLGEHPDIDQKQTTFVALVGFGPSSLDILIYTFTETTLWVPFQKIQQQVMLKIVGIIEAHGGECAFPTTTLDLPSDFSLSELAKEK